MHDGPEGIKTCCVRKNRKSTNLVGSTGVESGPNLNRTKVYERKNKKRAEGGYYRQGRMLSSVTVLACL